MYLTEHYALPDHRGEAEYETWQTDAATYAQTMETARAENQTAAEYQRGVLEGTAG